MDDIGTLLPNFRCPCGRATPVLKRIEGRTDSYVVRADGRRVGRISNVFQGVTWVRRDRPEGNWPECAGGGVVRARGLCIA